MAFRRVLIVEDHPPTRRLIENALAGVGIGTDSVTNGAEALTHMAHQKPDLVLSDFIMPHFNGMELAHAMRAKAELAHIPVVFVTAVDTPEVKRDSEKVGVKRILTKPFTPEKVVALVAEILAEKPAG